MTNVTPLPAHIDFDLDAYERPADEIIPDLVIKIDGKEIHFLNPEDLDWQDLLLIEQPEDFLRLVLSPEDRRHVQAAKMPAWRFRKMMDLFNVHFRMDEKIREAQRLNRR